MGLVDCQKTADTFHSLDIEVELLRDNLGFDPGLTNVPLHSTWEGISWVKSSLVDTLQTALSALQETPSPISHQDIHHIVSYLLVPSSSQSLALATKVNAL